MEELSPGVSSAGMSWKNVTCKQVLVLRTHLGSTMGVGLAGAASGLRGLAGGVKENISPFPYSDQLVLTSLGS